MKKIFLISTLLGLFVAVSCKKEKKTSQDLQSNDNIEVNLDSINEIALDKIPAISNEVTEKIKDAKKQLNDALKSGDKDAQQHARQLLEEAQASIHQTTEIVKKKMDTISDKANASIAKAKENIHHVSKQAQITVEKNRKAIEKTVKKGEDALNEVNKNIKKTKGKIDSIKKDLKTTSQKANSNAKEVYNNFLEKAMAK